MEFQIQTIIDNYYKENKLELVDLTLSKHLDNLISIIFKSIENIDEYYDEIEDKNKLPISINKIFYLEYRNYMELYLNKVNKQNGSSLFSIATDMILNTNTQTLKQNYQDIITIIYNRNTPKTIMLNSTSSNTLYQSSLVESVPHIQMKDYKNHY